MSEESFSVAIIGGGLCGLALAIGLSKRNIPYTIYEARSSFTEIGAGLNLGPNSFHAFEAIDPSLKEHVLNLATRNEPGREDVWMNLRLGAATSRFPDGHLVTSIHAPPTGNMTLARNELLQLLAKSIDPERAKFNKKVSEIDQNDEGVTITFADGTVEHASALIACDGAHSIVRRSMLGSEHEASTAKYTGSGVYRAVLPKEQVVELLGADKAHSSQIFSVANSYMIMYPIDGGKNVNLGLWGRRRGEWTNDSWVIDDQKEQMLKDFENAGPSIKAIMEVMSEKTQFWAGFHYTAYPDHYFDGRVCLIGDAAHAMSPHRGQGAAQAMEDAYVMAEVLRKIDSANRERSLSLQVQSAFHGFESIRRVRFEKVIEESAEGFEFWSSIWRPDVTQEDMEQFEKDAYRRFTWLWNEDIVGQGERAVANMNDDLYEGGKD